MQLTTLNNHDTITTIQLREMVNAARTEAGESPIRNDDFIARVESELEGELEGAKISHLAPRTKTPMAAYRLTLEQAMLVGMRESKAVRRAVLAALKDLQRQIAELKAQESQRLAERQAARMECPAMASALITTRAQEGKDTAAHHYSNEYDLINRIVLGRTAKAYRKHHGFEAKTPIRDTLTDCEIAAVADLQRINTALIDAGLEYGERKERLKRVFDRKHSRALLAEILMLEA